MLYDPSQNEKKIKGSALTVKQCKELLEKLKESFYDEDEEKFEKVEIADIKEFGEAEKFIKSAGGKVSTNQVKTLQSAIHFGEGLKKIQDICKSQKPKKKSFAEYMKECKKNNLTTWSTSYAYFFIKLFNLSKEYPTIGKLAVSIYYMKQQISNIKEAIQNEIKNDQKCRKFWVKG